jgi:hypothetical protein
VEPVELELYQQFIQEQTFIMLAEVVVQVDLQVDWAAAGQVGHQVLMLLEMEQRLLAAVAVEFGLTTLLGKEDLVLLLSAMLMLTNVLVAVK